VPSPPGEFSRDLYRDGFHLNDQGSEIFTTRLANQIRTEIGEISHSSLHLGTPAQKVASAGDR
jgi:hypothetical protein